MVIFGVNTVVFWAYIIVLGYLVKNTKGEEKGGGIKVELDNLF